MLRNFIIGLWRTAVTAALGWVAAWLLSQGFELGAETQVDLAAGSMVVLYAIFAGLEKKWPKIGWMLGWGAGPEYRTLHEPDTSTKQGFEEPSQN